MTIQNDNNTLPQGYQLHWYEIVDVIGRGGFGITYLARDKHVFSGSGLTFDIHYFSIALTARLTVV